MTLATPVLAVPLADGFYDMGSLGGTNNQINALSADGSVVVGGPLRLAVSTTMPIAGQMAP